MIRAVIAYPLKVENDLPEGYEEGYPSEWVTNGGSLLKQIGFLGNAKYRSARIYSHKTPTSLDSPSGSFAVTRVLIWRRKPSYTVLVVSVNSNQRSVIDQLSRPSLKFTSDWIHKTLELQVDSDSLVRATCISDFGSEVLGHDGQLDGVSSSNFFAFELQACQLAAVVATERILINSATKATSRPGILFLNARKQHALLSNWLTIPSSDSTRLLRETAILRDSLSLDSRRFAVQNSLESFNKSSNLAVATTLGAFSLSSTVMFSSLQPNALIEGSALVLLSLCISVLLGFVAWISSKP